MGRNIGPNQSIRTNVKPPRAEVGNGGRRSLLLLLKNLILQWLPLSSLYQNPSLLFRSKPFLLLQLIRSFSVLTKTWNMSCLFAFPVIRRWFLFFPNVSAGTRRGCLRIKAISTKWEPTKVLPFFRLSYFYPKCIHFAVLNHGLLKWSIVGCSSSRQGSCSSWRACSGLSLSSSKIWNIWNHKLKNCSWLVC